VSIQIVISATCSTNSLVPSLLESSGVVPAAADSCFALAAEAKLMDGRIVADKEALADFGDTGAEGAELVAVGGGVRVRLSMFRSMPVRELVRDIESGTRSFISSRSFSILSATSFSREVTSTGFAAPKGLERETGVADILGDDNGLGVADGPPDRGRSSSLRRPSWGVGGVEVVGDVLS